MSEVKLNIVDAQRISHGTVHGSIADACVAALSAEPETIAELEAALTRYVKSLNESGALGTFRSGSEIDADKCDAGVVIIDLAARIVAAESSYSQPQREGAVPYHDGTKQTDVSVLYRVPDDWKFLNSIAEYECAPRRTEGAANQPLDARCVLYGRALLEFVASNVRQVSGCGEKTSQVSGFRDEQLVSNDDAIQAALAKEISAIHARWLITPLADLRGQTPRELLLARREFIDFDLHTRQLQWSFQGEGPPCLAPHSFAYRFAGFGTQECIVYYDLVRHLLWESYETGNLDDIVTEIARLDQIKTRWLESPQPEYGGKIPAIIIENERRRLPVVLSAREMIIDEDCAVCVASANDVAMGYGPSFWFLDGSNMDDEFAFSFSLTREEWEAENLRREEFDKEFNRKWQERQERLARGEQVDDEFSLEWIDSLDDESIDSSAPADLAEPGDTVQ